VITESSAEMRKPAHARRFMPFGVKLFLAFIMLVITPLALVGIVTYTTSVKSVKSLAATNTSGTLRQVRDNIMYKIEPIYSFMTDLSADRTFHGGMKRNFTVASSYRYHRDYLITKLQTGMNQIRTDVRLSLYVSNNQLPEVYNTDENNPLLRRKYFQLFHLNRLDSADWYPSLKSAPARIHWLQIEEDQRFGNISAVRTIHGDNGSVIGLIRVTVPLRQLFPSADKPEMGEGSILSVKDLRSGTILFTSQGAGTEKGAPLSQEDHFLILNETVTLPDWSLTASIPLSELEKNPKRIRDLTIGISAICMIVLTLVSLAMSKFFTSSIHKIVRTLNRFREGEFSRRIHYSGNDEFKVISEAYNEMAQQIEKLIEDVYVASIAHKDAELKALQAQINPHFLYNTLSSISRLAKLGRTDELHRMVLGLSRFYRLSLNDGKMTISVDNEILQCLAYIDIQKIKYGENLEVSTSIDPDVLSHETVKLLLQPFIENAILHAWVEERLHIRLEAFMEDGFIVFKVIDNGAGMRVEKIRYLMESDRAGYGILNVRERIRLQYGTEAELAIHSRPGIGTAVVIRIPAGQSARSKEA
jgi:two-component system sensor histidine kinase YesM